MGMSHTPNEKQTQTIISSLLKTADQVKQKWEDLQIKNLPHIYRKLPCPNFPNEQQTLSNNSYNKQMPLILKKMEACREMEIPIDCLIDSPESIPFITNSLPIGVILELKII